ncbi:hypothetical protein QE152_g20747 [Popillia japonica]|uniref:Uncharacterized protein n=1 Tax=Popillia japonica TaxID=7064 RepID=A0AAW1KP21_POPJA
MCIFYFLRNVLLRLLELLELAENLDEEEIVPDGIVITSPDKCNEYTDCDSGDEGSNNSNHMNHNQLQAEAEFYFSEDEAEIEQDEEDDLPLSTFVKRSKLDDVKCK